MTLADYMAKYHELYTKALEYQEGLAVRPWTYAERQTFLSGFSAGFEACREMEVSK